MKKGTQETKQILGGCAFLIIALIGVFWLSGSHAKGEKSIFIEHDKDLLISPKVGYGVFKWSPDSNHIAFAGWSSGGVGIVNINTGEVRNIPNFEMNSISSISWTLDGGGLAISSPDEIRIIRLADFQTIHEVDVKKIFGSSLRLGHSTEFSKDGENLLITNPNDDGHVLVYSYNLATSSIESFLKSPFGDRRIFQDRKSGRFQWHDGHLYFSIRMVRYDETTHAVVNKIDRGILITPSTCIVADFGDGLQAKSVRSIDFPPKGREDADGSKEVFDCSYSASSDSIIGRVPFPYDFEKQGRDFVNRKVFFQTFDLNTSTSIAVFGKEEGPDRGAFDLYETHPFLPLIAATAYPPDPNGQTPSDSLKFLSVWDYRTGQALARFTIPRYYSSPEFSPDGTRLAFHADGETMPLYKLNIDLGDER